MSKTPNDAEVDQDLERPLMLSFPWFHPEGETERLPDSVCFLDPGIGDDDLQRTWRPSTLPLSKQEAALFLRESAKFARERGGNKGLLNTSVLAGDDYYGQTALSIQSKLTGGANTQQVDYGVRCQQLLLLAWQHQEQAIEIRKLQQRVHDGFESLEESLGLEDLNDHAQFSGARAFLTPSDQEQILPWSDILEALLFFLPPETVLVTTLQDISDSLAHIGSSSDEESFFLHEEEQVSIIARNIGARIIHASGWELLGKSRCPKEKPWLATTHLMLVASPQNMTTEITA